MEFIMSYKELNDLDQKYRNAVNELEQYKIAVKKCNKKISRLQKVLQKK